MWIAKNNDLIVLVRETRAELEQALKFMVYTSIEETDKEYILYKGSYVTEEEILPEVKQAKYDEANNGAKVFLESGDALFEFETGKHIEATDGNIAKLTAYALAYVTGQLQPTETVVWNTKEDETVELNAEQIGFIVKGLGYVQASVWSVQFPQYLQAIETAETIEEVNAINIEYYSDVPVTEEMKNEL